MDNIPIIELPNYYKELIRDYIIRNYSKEKYTKFATCDVGSYSSANGTGSFYEGALYLKDASMSEIPPIIAVEIGEDKK